MRDSERARERVCVRKKEIGEIGIERVCMFIKER